jgi:hypothetical protein
MPKQRPVWAAKISPTAWLLSRHQGLYHLPIARPVSGGHRIAKRRQLRGHYLDRAKLSTRHVPYPLVPNPDEDLHPTKMICGNPPARMSPWQPPRGVPFHPTPNTVPFWSLSFFLWNHPAPLMNHLSFPEIASPKTTMRLFPPVIFSVGKVGGMCMLSDE